MKLSLYQIFKQHNFAKIGVIFLFLAVLLIGWCGLLSYSVENFKQGIVDNMVFFINTSLILAGLTSLGGLIGNSKDDKNIHIDLILISIIFLISGILFILSLFLIFLVNYTLFGVNYQTFGGVTLMIGAFLFVFGCLVFPFVLICNFSRKIKDRIKDILNLGNSVTHKNK